MGETVAERSDPRGLGLGNRLIEDEKLAIILEACKRGDGAAWKTFYDAHFGYVYRIARKLGTPESEIEDVVSEVFLVVYRKLDDFQSGRITTWLYRICANVASGFHRKRRAQSALLRWKEMVGLKTTDTRTPQIDAERKTAQYAVAKILERMSAKNRDVIVLFELEGLSGEEIAEQLGCPVGTVWTRLHNARKQFAKFARQLGYDELGEAI